MVLMVGYSNVLEIKNVFFFVLRKRPLVFWSVQINLQEYRSGGRIGGGIKYAGEIYNRIKKIMHVRY